MTKKLLALLMALVMCLSLVPTVALAGDGDGKTIADILPGGFPADESNAWVCDKDRNKVIYNDGSKLVIGDYSSGPFNEQDDFNCPTASVVIWDEDGRFYSCEPQGYGTIKFNMDMESDDLKNITFDYGSIFDGTYSPLTIKDVLPGDFPTSAKGAWENSKENSNVCVYRDGTNLTFHDTEVAVSLSSLLTRADYIPDSAFTCTFEYVGASNFTIQFNMNNDGTALENIVVSHCTYDIVDGTYEPPEETVSYTVTYDANGATSGSAPTDPTGYASGASVTVLGNTGTLAKDGYTFDGWNTKSDGTGTSYAAGSNFTITADTTLYAKWTSVAHTHTMGTTDTTDDITFEKAIKTFADLQDLFTNGGSGYLANDITATAALSVAASKTVNLCLNDKVLNLNKKGNITVVTGAEFNLYDCGKTVRYYDKADNGLWTLNTAKTSGDCSTTGGVITGGNADNGGGGVDINCGTFNMTGGNIVGNTTTYNEGGGGVHVNKTGSFSMTGGNIVGNTATEGGGVTVMNGTFDMSGGEIKGNTAATNGGGVYANGGTFNMSGGEIKGNTATGNGGGVHIAGTFNMSGDSKINDNKATNAGGGVYAGGGTFTMTDGEITGNNAGSGSYGVFGGGVSFFSATLNLGGTAKITGNTAGDDKTTNNLDLCKDRIVTLGTGAEGSVAKPTNGFEIGVTMASSGAFTGTAASGDVQYFLSDNADYFVNFNTDHLELKKTAYISGSTLYVDGMVRSGSLDAMDKETVTAIFVNTVSGAEADAFAGFGSTDVPVALTLPAGWQGDLPDEDGNWYGAKVELLTGTPTAVKDVTFQQRWPWNGNVDIGFTVTGNPGDVKNILITVKNGETVLASIPLTVTIPENKSVGTGKCVWDASTASLTENFHSENVTVEVAMVGQAAGQLWAGGPIWATANLGESEVAGHSEYGALYTFTDASANVSEGWRLPTKDEFEKLISDCTGAWDDTNKVYTFTGKGGYSSQSITLPAAGMVISGGRSYAGVYGYYWSSTPKESGMTSYALTFNSGAAYVMYDYDTNKYSVRPVKDATPDDITTVTSATSAKGTIDLRTSVALPQGTVKVSNVAFSANAWGDEPSFTSTDIGWKKTDVTPNTTGKIAEGLTGNDIYSAILPSKDGTYQLTHSAGDLTSFVTFTVTGYPSYAITNGTAATGAHGSITLPENAVVGNDVVVTVAPDNGYALKTLKYNDGTADYDITKNATTGEYQFTMPAKAVTVTAEFAPITYTVTYNANGHGTAPEAITKVVFGAAITAPTTPTVTGYTFGGWFKDAACTNAWNFNTDTVTANTTLYAKWTKNSSGRSGGTVTTVVTMPLIRMGNRGDSVKELQTKLNALGYDCGSVDGIFGSKTQAAVVAFQKAMGIGVDGIVGPETWGKLGVTGITVTTAPAAATSAVSLTISSNMPLITKGNTGDAVKALQTKLNALGYDCGKVDGIFGDKTLAAVKAYQTDKALLVDGMVGSQTWGALR